MTLANTMKLPTELFEVVCSYADLDTLLKLTQTGRHARDIAKSEFERNVQTNWPWVTSGWSKEIVSIPHQRMLMKQQYDGEEMPFVTERIVDDRYIHKDEPIPEEAELLLDPVMFLVNYTFNFRTLASQLPPEIPLGGDMLAFLNASGQLDASGNMIVTYFEHQRFWLYSLPDHEFIEDRPDSTTIDEWLYQCYSTEESYIVTKHRALQVGRERSTKPDYMVVLPRESKYEGYGIEVFFCSHQVFVVDYPTDDIDDEYMDSFFRLLDMETGSLTSLDTSSGEGFCMLDDIEDLWLEGPFMHVWSRRFSGTQSTYVYDILDGWTKFIYEQHDKPRHTRTCWKGYITYDRRVTVDYKNLVEYECPYEGDFVTVGLLDGELHWWTFPQAEEVYKQNRAILRERLDVNT